VAELTRISAQGEKKLKLRRASLVKAPTSSEPKGPEPDSNSKPSAEVDGEKDTQQEKAGQADESPQKSATV
jgi:hypothetical protein